MADLFISYSRKNSDFVRRLHHALHAREREAWVDWEGIPFTADWMTEIRAAVESARAFTVVISSEGSATGVEGIVRSRCRWSTGSVRAR